MLSFAGSPRHTPRPRARAGTAPARMGWHSIPARGLARLLEIRTVHSGPLRPALDEPCPRSLMHALEAFRCDRTPVR
ncbi:hypothetical protein EDF62_0647 [Leucobacter luti]|uniref:Uncharacterized protein n=1 Tax=Leucobacter luti TaxID=340320 RepID=A0A4R6S528_9MICO|nr:hypothetical protein EDF62_0647 [Leucobacter luti]